jgi:hypothetical protein
MPRHKYGQEPSAIKPTDDQPELAETSSPESQEKQRPMKQQAKAIQARWAGEQAAEDDLRDHFLTLPLEKALDVLKKMRSNCVIAGTILNERINSPNEQKCEVCGLTYAEMKKRKPDWWSNQPHYHAEDRNIILVRHFCSANCMSNYNNKTQGVRGIADQGMTPDMNPKNHPRQTHAAQTVLANKA